MKKERLENIREMEKTLDDITLLINEAENLWVRWNETNLKMKMLLSYYEKVSNG